MSKIKITLAIATLLCLAPVAKAQLSLSTAIYSEEKTNYEAPSNLGMYIYARDGLGFLGSYNASSNIEPTVIRGAELDIMLVNFNAGIQEISLKFVHPAILADAEHLKRLAEDDSEWSRGKRSDTAYLFNVDTRNLPPGHCIAILRCKTKTRNRHSFIVIIRWVTTGRETKDQGFALMVQDPPYGAEQIPLEGLMQLGLFGGFRPQRATLPEDAMKVLNQVTPGQSSSASQGQNQQSGLPPDLGLPTGGNRTNRQELLPRDLELPGPKMPEVGIRFMDRFDDPGVGKLLRGELETAMKHPATGDSIAVEGQQEAALYIWSKAPFEGAISKDDKSIKLLVYRAENGIYWARLKGPAGVLPGSHLDLKAGGKTRTVHFTEEVN